MSVLSLQLFKKALSQVVWLCVASQTRFLGSTFNPMLYNHPPQQHNYQPVHQEEHRMQHSQQMHIPLNVTLPTDPSPPNAPKRDEPPDVSQLIVQDSKMFRMLTSAASVTLLQSTKGT